MATKPSFATGRQLREACRAGDFTAPTASQAPGYVQANMVVLPAQYAEDFLSFCGNNAAPCPLLECTLPGIYEAPKLAPGSDLRRDLPRYHVWRDGVMTE